MRSWFYNGYENRSIRSLHQLLRWWCHLSSRVMFVMITIWLTEAETKMTNILQTTFSIHFFQLELFIVVKYSLNFVPNSPIKQ